MKKAILGTLIALASHTALATSDGEANIYIVSRSVQTEEYFVQRVPVIGCYGMEEGPALAQFAAKYNVPSNIGCGATGEFFDDINALSCAKMDYKYTGDYERLSTITLDLKACDDKNNPDLLANIQKAARLNFGRAISVVIKK